MTSLDVWIHHHIPGRIRLRIPDAKGKSQLLQEFSAAIAKVHGIERVEGNPVTGSILIQYSHQEYRDRDSLGSSLSAAGVPIVMRKEASVRHSQGARAAHRRRSHAAKAVDSFLNQLDYGVRDLTGNQIDLKFILPLAIGAIGISSLQRSSATPLWLTLLIFAFHSFLGLQSPNLQDFAAAEQLAERFEA